MKWKESQTSDFYLFAIISIIIIVNYYIKQVNYYKNMCCGRMWDDNNCIRIKINIKII